MKAISLLQPWATLVVEGVKEYETRSFNTSHRGRILIHASLGKSKETVAMAKNWPFNVFVPDFSALPFGAIIGCVDIVETYTTTKAIQENLLSEFCEAEKSIEYHLGDYSPGRFAWKLENNFLFQDPIPIKGSLSLWNVPDEVAALAQSIIDSQLGKFAKS